LSWTKTTKAGRGLLAALAVAGALSCRGGTTGAPAAAGGSGAAAPIDIALVTKAMDSEFWLVLADGAKAAAAAHPGVKLSILAPDREINIDQQVSILEDQTRRGVKALVVSPAGSAQVLSALEQATERGVPVILVDTDAPFDKKVTYIGTDNRRGGQLAAKGLADAIGGPAEVALIHGVPGNESQDARAQGFIDALASDYPALKLVARQPGNSERSLGLTVMENILTAHPGIKGVFATNDQMALGAMEALEARSLRGKIKIIGFDATKEAVQATVDGRLAGSVAQNPRMMGQRGVEAALAALEGKPVEKRIDTGTELVTAANAAKYLK
jgi:ribose transport system substrate-binding protein